MKIGTYLFKVSFHYKTSVVPYLAPSLGERPEHSDSPVDGVVSGITVSSLAAAQ